jgi:glycine cleavage system aminomethyltransferase T
VRIENVTEQWMTLSLVGPKSGQLVAALTDTAENDWKFLDAKNVNILT